MVNFLKVAPSTDPVPNEEELLSYVKKLNNIADYVHCDVMSKNFVSRDTINYETVRQIYLKTLLPLDVHLMVNEPLNLVEKYINAGAQIVTVHYEAFKNKNNLIKCLKLISKKGAIAGVAINPGTEVCEVMPYIAYADLVLVMSVEPGKGGQKFMPVALRKIKKLRRLIDKNNYNCLIEVDE